MADQNNNSIERFFRKKAREYNIQYKEEDWLKLESRLDELDKQHANRRRRRLAAAAVIILFSVLAYFTYQQHLKINQLNERLTERENVTDLPNLAFEFLPNPESATNDGLTNQGNLKSETETQPPAIASEEPSESQPNTSNRDFTKNATSEKHQQEFAQTNIVRSDLVVKIAKASPGLDGRSPAISAIRPSKTKPVHPSVDRRYEGQAPASKSPAPANPRQQTPLISIGLSVGPDLSTAGGVSDFSEPGHKFGISVEYHLSRNLAISAGAQRAEVRYTARGAEYQQNTGLYANSPSPAKTTAECILIDIPVNMKYTFLHFTESRLYATAGLSSYIMVDEKYEFDFRNNNPSGLPQQIHQRTGTGHLFSNATLSIGYEIDLMRKMSIRAEPFMKVPIKGVGLGNVNLYSVGSFVSLNYNIR